jgi:hypothetical protein
VILSETLLEMEEYISVQRNDMTFGGIESFLPESG